jgi:hypothetical protein
VEGDVAAAGKVDAVNELTNPVESDLLGDSAPPVSKPETSGRKTGKNRHARPAPARRKADQMALFDKTEQRATAKRASGRSKPQTARNKK